MEQILDVMRENWGGFVALAPRLVAALLVLLLSYVVGKYIAAMLARLSLRLSRRGQHVILVKIIVLTLALFGGSVIALGILGLERLAMTLLAGGGVTAVVLGFAFREIGENFLAGLFLAFSRPFNIGDTIRTEDIEGKVQDITLRNTHLRTEDGRDIFVPSSQLFNRPLTNFTRDGLRRIEFTVGMDYANDAAAACELLTDVAQKTEGVLSEPEAGAFILNLAPGYVEIRVFYWVDVFDTHNPVTQLRTRVMDGSRRALIAEGYTVSAETTSNIAVKELPADVGGFPGIEL